MKKHSEQAFVETSDEEEEGKELGELSRINSSSETRTASQDIGRVSERIVLEGAVSIRIRVSDLIELPSTYEFSDYQLKFEYDGDEG